MKRLLLLSALWGMLSCQTNASKYDNLKTNELDLETLAFEGIKLDFQFNVDQPTFGDLFLITGGEHQNFRPNSREFEKLTPLGFEQVDDYFGVKNHTSAGDDTKLWLAPIVNGKEVYHHAGPFDAVRISYIVLRNGPKTNQLFKEVFLSITSNFEVTTMFNGTRIESFSAIDEIVAKTIHFCRVELNVEPGSEAALLLEW